MSSSSASARRSPKARRRTSGRTPACRKSISERRRQRPLFARRRAVLLEVRDLHVRYGRVHAVKGVSINLAHGNIVAVLGANGAGKSSMLRALLGIEKISDGRVFFDGHDITHWTPSRRVANGLVLVPEG